MALALVITVHGSVYAAASSLGAVEEADKTVAEGGAHEASVANGKPPAKVVRIVNKGNNATVKSDSGKQERLERNDQGEPKQETRDKKQRKERRKKQKRDRKAQQDVNDGKEQVGAGRDNPAVKPLEDTKEPVRQQEQIVVKPVVPSNFVVKRGQRGEDVELVQNLLKELGYYADSVDGVCGNNTVNSIMQFQMSHNLTVDGIAGCETLAALYTAEPVVYKNMRSLLMSASAYSAYDPGNGHYTYRGSFLRKGLVAVDPSFLPLGTRLFIPGYGEAVADDIGGAIKGNRIDLAFDTHHEAIQFGRKEVLVYIIE